MKAMQNKDKRVIHHIARVQKFMIIALKYGGGAANTCKTLELAKRNLNCMQ